MTMGTPVKIEHRDSSAPTSSDMENIPPLEIMANHILSNIKSQIENLLVQPPSTSMSAILKHAQEIEKFRGTVCHALSSRSPTTTSADQVFGIFLGMRPQFSVSGIEADFHRTSFSSRFLWCPWLSSLSALC